MFESDEYGISVIEERQNRYRISVKGRNNEAMKALTKAENLVDEQDVESGTALRYTASRSPETVPYLFEVGANAELRDNDDETPSDYTTKVENKEVAKLMRKSRYSSSLHHAAELGDIEMMVDLLNSGVDVEIQDHKGFRPLECAVCAKNYNSTLYLLKQGAKIDKDNIYDMTALHIAAAIGAIEILKLLLSHGIDIDFQNDEGITPLYCAIRENQTEAVSLLLEWGANVHSVLDGVGNSALHIAAWKGGSEIGTMLIEAGAEINVCDDKGRTPVHVASLADNTEMLQFLLEQYANGKGRLFEESSESTKFSLTQYMAATVDVKVEKKIAAMVGNSDSIRWCCVIDVQNNDRPKFFHPHHAGAILLCIGVAVDKKTFLKLVERFLRKKGLSILEIMDCHKSPVGSLQEDVEQACINLEEKTLGRLYSEGKADLVVYLTVPAILRYGHVSKQKKRPADGS